MIVIQDSDKNVLTVKPTMTKALRAIGIRKYPSDWLYNKVKEAGNENPTKWKQYLISKW